MQRTRPSDAKKKRKATHMSTSKDSRGHGGTPSDVTQNQIVLYGSAFLLGVSIQRWLRSQLVNGRERLSAPAARAAQWTAAMRAVESMDGSALFNDDMAERMAGKRMFRRCLNLSAKVPLDHAGERLNKISEVALGTWWFDRQIMTLLTSNSLHSAMGWLSARLRNSARGLAGPPRQVVSIGSGFDTRPWRMAMPPMTKWLEIDTKEVVAAKLRRLKACNAELKIHSNTGYYPLRTIQWDIHAVDIAKEHLDFGKLMDMYGLDLDSPIVWLVENVLWFLPPERVKHVLLHMSAVSSPGSIVIGNSTVNRGAELLGEGKHGSYPADVVGHWVSSLPGRQEDLHVALQEAGWDLMESCSQEDIAETVCNGRDISSMCSGGVGEDVCEGEHRPEDVYFFARKV